jgi:hypothetical protein
MKIFTNILVFLALALIIFNITLLDFSHPFQGDSMVAFVESDFILRSVNPFDFWMSKKIEEKMNDNI